MTLSKKPLFGKLVVASDNQAGMDVALAKAAMIEHYSGAAIEVVEVIYDTIAEEPQNILPREQQALLIEGLKAAERNGLRTLTKAYQDRVADLETRVLWHKNAAESIISELKDADFLIKPFSREHSLLGRLHAPLDWALMRAAPCPVLISKHDWSEVKRVMAAIDAGDESHNTLNRAILETATDLARILGCELQIVAAYPSLGQSVNELQVASDFDGIKADMKEARARLIETLISELGIDVAKIHLLEGNARDVIPKLSNEMGAVLTVLGTAARRGLSQLILGNTAEAIIGALDGDLVTVREPA